MRPIKFRAWKIADKYMITSKQAVAGILQKHLLDYSEGMRNGNGHVVRGDYEIMQFTGLKDKNGKEVYEGDILTKWRPKRIEGNQDNFVVEYLVGMSGYYRMKNSEGFHLSHEQNLLDGMIKDIIVIGNIHENPDLLK
jgi:uncharacterized phage protein (TIGR01671 family)